MSDVQRNLPFLPNLMIERPVRAALLEDLGRAGDITSASTIGAEQRAEAHLAAREAGIVCGLPLAAAAFRLMDAGIDVETEVADGDVLKAGKALMRVSGNARAMLSAERTALNYLMHLSGVATMTKAYVDAIADTGARICCTRKTIPGMRALQKYAVACGGGSNHRFGLDDAILIKDNHIAVAGGVAAAVHAARAYAGHLVQVEVEVDTLDQMREALTARPDVILLDNMPPETLENAVRLNGDDNGGRVRLEASGNVSLETVKAIAETGVDYISTSKITMAAMPLDIGLDIGIG